MRGGEQFWRGLALVALLLVIALSAERYFRIYWFSETEPRVIAPRADLASEEKLATAVFRTAAPSVVSIYVRRGRGPFQQNTGTGTGFIWDKAGHIVTNSHVVSGGSEIGVVIGDERSIPATLVGEAPWADLAVLRLQVLPETLTPIAVGQSSDLLVGQSVYAIGNPFGLQRSLTTGIISALDRRLPTREGREVAGVIQTDAAINPGNSGGPLVDSSARLIGVNTAILAPTGAFSGVGFAIPVDIVNRIVPAIIRDGRAPMPGIGILALPEEISAGYGVRGVVIHQVIPGSPAARAGLRGVTPEGEVGDIIVGVEGRPIATVGDLFTELDRTGIGNEAKLQVLRRGRRIEVAVEVSDISA
jgi:2-alkenal reductase